MEFELVAVCSFNTTTEHYFGLAFLFASLLTEIICFAQIIVRLFSPLGNGNLTHIEFPLPQIIPSTPYEPLPVAMMVGSCSEAKRCAYCHEEFDCDSARRFCFACKSATHEECAILNGGCSVFGCTDTTLLRQV